MFASSTGRLGVTALDIFNGWEGALRKGQVAATPNDLAIFVDQGTVQYTDSACFYIPVWYSSFSVFLNFIAAMCAYLCSGHSSGTSELHEVPPALSPLPGKTADHMLCIHLLLLISFLLSKE